MPDEIAGLPVGDGPVVRNTRDAAERVVGIVSRCVHLADDRVFGPGDGGKRSHGGTDTVAAMVVADRLQRSRWVG
jgi:hypothetical protein